MLSALIAVITAGLFAGKALYPDWFRHVNVIAAVKGFEPYYRSVAPQQAGFAVIGMIAALYTWYQTGGTAWFIGGVAFGAVIPWTLVHMMPTNTALFVLGKQSDDEISKSGTALLNRWANMHRVRSLLSIVAFVMFAYLIQYSE